MDEVTGRIKDAVRAIGESHGVDIGMSVGTTAITEGSDFDALVHTADQKMYADKAENS